MSRRACRSKPFPPCSDPPSGRGSRPSPRPRATSSTQTPPLSFDAEAVGLAPVEGYRTRVKVFDYGVVSVALTQPYAGTWGELVTLGLGVIDNSALERDAEAVCRRLLDRMRAALSKPRATFLAEDYVVFSVTGLSDPLSSDALVERHGTDIAQLLRAEKQTLSRQEREEVLRHRLSYLADDLVVPTWNAALVYDTEAGAQAALEILEFANSQLLEFRYYDELLDAELARIYTELQKPAGRSPWWRGRHTRAAHQVQSLLHRGPRADRPHRERAQVRRRRLRGAPVRARGRAPGAGSRGRRASRRS